MKDYFDFAGRGTGYRQETLAGATTFLTMAYIIIVNPAILEAAGIPKGPSMVATILSAAFGTVVMGLYAKRPFAIAPYMGENAFVSIPCQGPGVPADGAGAASCGRPVHFVMLSRSEDGWLSPSPSLKQFLGSGSSFLLGLNETGLVRLASRAPVSWAHHRADFATSLLRPSCC
jgi:AGZA family xanthine/uracil permease-like MFS transporter